MRTRRLLIWLMFGVFVIVSWIVILGYAFFAGWSSCEVRHACTSDRVVGILLWLILPAQGLIVALIKVRLEE
jgi:hypothetical protein